MSTGHVTRPEACPCGSGSPYRSCCEPFLDGAPAPTAEQLMRSRYTAYVRGHENHLFRTWHPATRPADVRPDHGVTWLGLEVVRTEAGGPEDDHGTVTFAARYRTARGEHVLHETSRFERRAGRWVYRDGDVTG